MNTTTLHAPKLQGFKVVPKHRLPDLFDPSQSAYCVLLGRRGAPQARRQSVLFVGFLEHFLDDCQQRITQLWEKHRVPITHVAVKLGKSASSGPRDLAALYDRAVTIQQLRHRLHARFRRI